MVTHLFRDASIHFVFDKFRSLASEFFTDEAFKCFRAFFNRINANAGLLQVIGENRYLVNHATLVGVETLWRLAISSPVASVANDASILLVLLQKNVSDAIAKVLFVFVVCFLFFEISIQGHLAEFRHSFVQQCMTQLQQAVAASDTHK